MGVSELIYTNFGESTSYGGELVGVWRTSDTLAKRPVTTTGILRMEGRKYPANLFVNLHVSVDFD